MNARSTLFTSRVGSSCDAGFGWRVAVSLASVFGLASFLPIYFAFWCGSFSVLQTTALILAAILTFTAMNGAAWASWGVRYART